jgi:signal transduction histidine kinase
MKSLRSRLLASYTLVIVVCLVVVAAATLLFLLRRSLPDRQVYLDLAAKSRVALFRPVRDELLRDQSPERLTRTLQRISDTQQERVILTEADGIVIADTHDSLTGHNLLKEARLSKRTADVIQGSFRPAATWQRWLFVGRALPPSHDRWFIVARQVPRLPIFQIFGENMLSPLVQAGLLGLILSVLLAGLISRSVARPIQQTAAAARAIADGDYDQQLPLGGPTEVRELATSFNQMARQVKASHRAQRDFVANVSHDLKTPLTSIQGFSQAILDGTVADTAETQRAASIIHQEAGRMRRMVDDLLLLARMDAGELQLARQTVDLAQLLAGCITRMEARAHQGGVVLRLTTPPAGIPPITGDGDRLVQLFTNLLDNALKHTPAGGQVTATTELANREVVISVADTGPGIPPEHLPRVFERFYQVDRSRARSQTSGVGLGLAICKELAEAHGGRISVESVVGVGTRFSVYLPLADSAPTVAHRR